ncbi:MAG: TIGR00725 family protein [Candidatus Eisenbacteria bacterium]|nr:TIGR00725 family protein [Candidatus Eisenbacteria bacterium]
MAQTRKTAIGVIGTSSPSREEWEAAYEVGKQVALKGGIVITGGLGGVMEAASKGAKESGGTTVGILPGGHASDANPYVDVVIITELAEARNLIIVKSSDALVAVGGGYGTLSEIAFGLKLGIPVVGIQTWELSKAGDRDESIARVETPTQAVDLAFKLTRGIKS